MPNGKIVNQFFYRRYASGEYENAQYSIFTLLVCEDSRAPTYADDSGIEFSIL
jgi:hypothetical protein